MLFIMLHIFGVYVSVPLTLPFECGVTE